MNRAFRQMTADKTLQRALQGSRPNSCIAFIPGIIARRSLLMQCRTNCSDGVSGLAPVGSNASANHYYRSGKEEGRVRAAVIQCHFGEQNTVATLQLRTGHFVGFHSLFIGVILWKCISKIHHRNFYLCSEFITRAPICIPTFRKGLFSRIRKLHTFFNIKLWFPFFSFFSSPFRPRGSYQSNANNVHSHICFKIVDDWASLNFIKYSLSTIFRQNLSISLNLN